MHYSLRIHEDVGGSNDVDDVVDATEDDDIIVKVERSVGSVFLY